MFGITNIKAIAAIKTVATIVGIAVCGVAGATIVTVLDWQTILWIMNVIFIGLIAYFMYQIYLGQLEYEQRNKKNNG
jgi:hypothetical protein